MVVIVLILIAIPLWGFYLSFRREQKRLAAQAKLTDMFINPHLYPGILTGHRVAEMNNLRRQAGTPEFIQPVVAKPVIVAKARQSKSALVSLLLVGSIPIAFLVLLLALI